MDCKRAKGYFWEVMEIFCILIEVVVSQPYTKVKTHLTAYFKSRNLLYVHYAPIKLF